MAGCSPATHLPVAPRNWAPRWGQVRGLPPPVRFAAAERRWLQSRRCDRSLERHCAPHPRDLRRAVGSAV
ncbi:hypothetical protein MRX96_055882 [Rhipicephalus microplus]